MPARFSNEVYLEVIEAMNQAEEIGFESEEYVTLMAQIIAEAARRIQAFQQYCPVAEDI